MLKKIPVLLIALSFITGCGTQPTKYIENSPTTSLPTDNHDSMPMDAGDDMTNMPNMKMENLSTLAGNRIKLDNTTPLRLGANTLRFNLYTSGGKELTDADLDVVHDKKIHLILVRSDLFHFEHLHPEYSGGKWRVTTSLPETGTYNLYFDFSSHAEGAMVLRLPVTVQTTDFLKQTQPLKTVSTQGTIKNELSISSLQPQTPSQITFTLSQNNKPLEKFGEYLGAYGHVVILKTDNPEVYLHVHPLTEVAPTNGQIQFSTMFPEIGRYTLFAQFNIDGAIKTFTFTVEAK